MENFLKKFSTIPMDFLTDFYVITKEDYDDNDLIIDFDIVCKWLNTRKDDLKKVLVKNFEDSFDYTISKEKKAKKRTESNYIS
jgi:hypothetical protein